MQPEQLAWPVVSKAPEMGPNTDPDSITFDSYIATHNAIDTFIATMVKAAPAAVASAAVEVAASSMPAIPAISMKWLIHAIKEK